MGGKMMNTRFMITLAVFASLAVVAIAGAENNDAALRAQYAEQVDVILMHCDQKSRFSRSAGRHLRQCASMNCQKSSFIRNNRQLLLDEMARDCIQAKPYKVEYFINERFFSIIRGNNPDLIQGYAPPDEIPASLNDS
jgi:hypothetical protein